jgi:molybdopterin-guanine dinucleotide biosynthesis protein A
MIGLVHAFILAGGRSSRFGSDKARACIDGQPLIQRLANALASDVASVTVVAQQQDGYQDLGLRTIADYQVHGGPLAGLLRALEDLRMVSFPSRIDDPVDAWALVLSCDLIRWEPNWLIALRANYTKNPATLAIAFRSDRWQPFPGLYHSSLAKLVRRRTELGDASMHGLLDDPATKTVAVGLAGLPPIQSANTPDELQGWQREDSRSPGE